MLLVLKKCLKDVFSPLIYNQALHNTLMPIYDMGNLTTLIK